MAFEDGRRALPGRAWALRKLPPRPPPVTPPASPTGSGTTGLWRGRLLLFAEDRNTSTKDRLTPEQALTAITTWLCGTESNDRV